VNFHAVSAQAAILHLDKVHTHLPDEIKDKLVAALEALPEHDAVEVCATGHLATGSNRGMSNGTFSVRPIRLIRESGHHHPAAEPAPVVPPAAEAAQPDVPAESLG
jgi:hypothetical protein